MTRRSYEDFQRDKRERSMLLAQRTTPGDEERKQRIKSNGLDCLRRLHGDQTWSDWMGTGEALQVITEEALAALGLSEWHGDNKPLVNRFNKMWEEYEAETGSNYKPITKQERWALRTVMANPEIVAFRARLDGPKQRRLNHPNAVINKWKASTQTREPKKDKPTLRDSVASLSEELEASKRHNEDLQHHLEELQAARESSDAPLGPLTIEQHFAALIELLSALPVKVVMQKVRAFQDGITTAIVEAKRATPEGQAELTAAVGKRKRGRPPKKKISTTYAMPLPGED
jgi:hypothetical protein